MPLSQDPGFQRVRTAPLSKYSIYFKVHSEVIKKTQLYKNHLCWHWPDLTFDLVLWPCIGFFCSCWLICGSLTGMKKEFMVFLFNWVKSQTCFTARVHWATELEWHHTAKDDISSSVVTGLNVTMTTWSQIKTGAMCTCGPAAVVFTQNSLLIQDSVDSKMKMSCVPTSQPCEGSSRKDRCSPTYGPYRSPTFIFLRLQMPRPLPGTSDSRSSKSVGMFRYMFGCWNDKASWDEASSSERSGDIGSSAGAGDGSGSPSEPQTSSKMSDEYMVKSSSPSPGKKGRLMNVRSELTANLKTKKSWMINRGRTHWNAIGTKGHQRSAIG